FGQDIGYRGVDDAFYSRSLFAASKSTQPIRSLNTETQGLSRQVLEASVSRAMELAGTRAEGVVTGRSIDLVRDLKRLAMRHLGYAFLERKGRALASELRLLMEAVSSASRHRALPRLL